MSLQIVLASTSIFRKDILKKLDIPFDTASPEIDESPVEMELPSEMVKRLSLLKARDVAKSFPENLIIGSDQVACIDDEIMGKPGNYENAFEQLSKASGRKVCFYTGLSLFNSQSGNHQTVCVPFYVHFRQLSSTAIQRYLEKEQPYNCAGSFKSEGYGITLFKKLEGDDPNTLIGLPLISLIEMLGKEGIALP